MKKIFLILIALIIVSNSPAFAKPERLQMETSDKRTAKRSAKQALKTVDVQSIKDPEARKAIKQILNYLNLQSAR